VVARFRYTLAGTARCGALSIALFLASAGLRCVAAQVFVSPDGGAMNSPSYSSADTAWFSLTGLVSGQRYTLEWFCSGAVTSCNSPDGSSFTASAYGASWRITFSTAAPGAGTVKLKAYGPSNSDSGWFNVTNVQQYAVSVTPDGAMAPTRAANGTGYSESFTVTNTGYYADSYTLSCSGTDVGCSGVSPGTITQLASGGNTSITVSYYTEAVGTGTLTLKAVGAACCAPGAPASDTGFFSVPVVATGVAVTPDNGTTAARLASSGPFKDVFTIQNTGGSTKTFSVTCSGSSNVTCSGVSKNTVPLTAGASTTDTATYTVSGVGTGSLSLTATAPEVSDAGSYRIGVVASTQQAPTIAVGAVNAGTVSERALCFSIALGPAAASECGDLRIVHPLPTTRTMNKARTPTLLYNSQVAHPNPLVAALVTLPTTAIPDSIEATLTVNGTVRRRGQWPGSQWAPGTTRRIALTYDGGSDATGIYNYTLEVLSLYGTSRLATDSTGQLVVVNRQTSPFGAGWWLAGLEQLNVGNMLWVGGDGSVHQYQAAGAGVWFGPNVDHPDTLKQVVHGDTTYYVRYLPKGVQVWFDAHGRQVYTYNRQRHLTRFVYDTIKGVLDSIIVPTVPPYVRAYTLAYTPSAPYYLTSVTAPDYTSWQGFNVTRVVQITDSVGLTTQIQDPDGKVVRFAPVAGCCFGLVQARTDRRGTTVSYTYDAGTRISGSYVSPNATQTSILTITAQETRGLRGAPSVDSSSAFTLIDGPRTDSVDVTQVWVDRWGQPTQLQDAHGFQTRVRRSDTLPGLVAEVDHANGWRETATYDARGNLASTTDYGFGGQPTTTYQWDQTWDALTKIKRPEGDSVVMAYDAATGNRLWQQDGRGSSTRVTFRYNSASQLVTDSAPATPAESLFYDTKLGDVTVIKSPMQFDTRDSLDAIGRAVKVWNRIDPSGQPVTYQTTLTYSDVLDRDTLQVAIGPDPNNPSAVPETVYVRNFYNANGQTDSLWRSSGPDVAGVGIIRTSWRHDAVGRDTLEVAPDGNQEKKVYDLAGNVIADSTRRKDPTSGTRLTINMTYDALNRPVTRVLPQITYRSRPTAFLIQPTGAVWTAQDYPAYAIPTETHTFTYDPLGRLLTAENADAKIRRSYYPNGLLQTDSLRIQTVDRTDWTRHVYGLGYTYDRDGRRTVLDIPHQLGIGNNTSITYAYDPQIGLLKTLTDLQGNAYPFGYDVQGDLSSITYPGSYREGLGYDADGQLAADTVWNNGSGSYPRIQSYPLVRATRFFYDAGHRLQSSGDAIQLRDTLRATYSGLGNLKSTYWTEHGCDNCSLLPTDRHATVESFTQDAIANLTQSSVLDSLNGTQYFPWGDQWHYQSSTTCCDTWSYQPGTGGMTTMSVAQQYPRSFYYDSAGNQEFSSAMDTANGKVATERASFFAADGSLRMVDARAAKVPHVYMGDWQTYAVEDYRYDALGRRVWVRARKWCDDYGKAVPDATECRVGVLRRAIWDGDRELAEIQMPWALQGVYITGYDTTQQQQLWENDVNPVSLPLLNVTGSQVGDPNPYFGHVIYAGGRGVDQPFAITRVNYVMGMDWHYGNNGSQYHYNPPRVKAPFTIAPFWNARGDAPVGVFSSGDVVLCGIPHLSPLPDTGCVAIRWPWNWSSSDRNGGLPHDYWHGTLLEGHRDASGFRYMRNRYYDPLTGRFTQEDPSGLAGGLNSYGFAAGDAINFGDPFGLGPDDDCRAHGDQDWTEWVMLGYVGTTNIPINVPIVHDCSKERKAHEASERRAHEEAKCVGSFTEATPIDPCTDPEAARAVARCGLDQAWTLANLGMDVWGGAKLLRLAKAGLVRAGLGWAWENVTELPKNGAIRVIESGSKGKLEGRGLDYDTGTGLLGGMMGFAPGVSTYYAGKEAYRECMH